EHRQDRRLVRDGNGEAAEIAHFGQRFQHYRKERRPTLERQPHGIGANGREDLAHHRGRAQLTDGIADRAEEARGAIDRKEAGEELGSVGGKEVHLKQTGGPGFPPLASAPTSVRGVSKRSRPRTRRKSPASRRTGP